MFEKSSFIILELTANALFLGDPPVRSSSCQGKG